MRFTLKACFAVALFAFGSLTVGAQVNQMLKRMERNSRTLRSLRADLEREDFNAQLQETDRLRGNLRFVRKPYTMFRCDWAIPFPGTLLVKGHRFLSYNPQLRVIYEGILSPSDQRMWFDLYGAFLGMNKTKLKASFNISYTGTERVGGTDTLTLRFVPKNPDEPVTLTLWLDGNGMPIQVRATRPNGDRYTVRLKNIVRNKRILSKWFRLTFPKRTRVVKL